MSRFGKEAENDSLIPSISYVTPVISRLSSRGVGKIEALKRSEVGKVAPEGCFASDGAGKSKSRKVE